MNLFPVGSREALHRFQLDHDLALHHKVGPEPFVKDDSPIANRDTDLTLHHQTSLSKFVGKDDLINTFQ